MLLPLQGVLLYMRLPRASPWSRRFWALAFPSAADFQFSPFTSCTFARTVAFSLPSWRGIVSSPHYRG